MVWLAPHSANTLHGVLERKMAEFGNRPFLHFGEQSWGYADVDREARRVASGLQRMGIARGDKVAIISSNRPEYLFLLFGLSRLGAIEVPLNTAHKGDLLTYMLARSDSRLLVVEAELLDVVAAALPEVPQLERLVVLDNLAPSEIGGVPAVPYGAMTANDGRPDEADVRWDDAVAIMFTSGTTGPSKGALLPQNYPLHVGGVIAGVMGYDDTDRLYTCLPLFHGNAQFLSMVSALLSGAQLVLARRFSAGSFWNDLRRWGCTAVNTIGGITSILMKADPQPDDADNPVERIFTAGTLASVHRAFEQRFGVRLIEGYGMSEIGMPLMTQNGNGRPGSCGTLHPDYQVRIVDDDGIDVQPNTPGELLVRSRTVNAMQLEYYGMPEKTVEAWRDLWFHTGDTLSCDEDGWYYFHDRKKDAIRRRGENISSFEVEAVINAHPHVRESAAIAVRSELGEDDVMVCVVRKDGVTVTAPELIEHCSSRMASFMVPRYVRFLEALPKTPTERVEKYRLRAAGVTKDTWDREPAALD